MVRWYIRITKRYVHAILGAPFDPEKRRGWVTETFINFSLTPRNFFLKAQNFLK